MTSSERLHTDDTDDINRRSTEWFGVRYCRLSLWLISPLGAPHSTVLTSVLTAQLITAQLDRECVGNSVRLCS